MIVDIARRGLSHPKAVAYVKRSFETYPDKKGGPEPPVWGIVLVYVTFFVAMVGISLVSLIILSTAVANLTMHRTRLEATHTAQNNS